MRLHNGLAFALVLLLGRSRIEDSSLGKDLSACLALGLIGAATHLVNDLLDVGADRTNRPARALPAGLLAAGDLRRAAVVTWSAGMLVGLILIPEWALWWLFWGLAGPGYSLVVKGRGWAAPLWTAAVIASCWLAGALDSGLRRWDLPILAGMVLYLVFRELVKIQEDSRGDLLAGYVMPRRAVQGAPVGVIGIGAVLASVAVWIAWTGPGLLVRLSALFFLASLLGGTWSLLNPRVRRPHLAGTLLKLGAFAGVAMLWGAASN
jgi:4-hydroxybenzoate polyprenyltransferase